MKTNRKIYYAHFIGIYNTHQEKRDINLLKTLFPEDEIINPNQFVHQENSKKLEKPMVYFENLVKSCDIIAFRGCVNGKIGAGVFKEIEVANELGLPVIELPSLLDRQMTVSETRLMLQELGVR